MERTEYYEYMKSPAWYKRTESVRTRNRGLCEVCCLRYGAQVHHRTYENLGVEKDEDLIHLCGWCHEGIHDLRDTPFMWPTKMNFFLLLRKEAEKL